MENSGVRRNGYPLLTSAAGLLLVFLSGNSAVYAESAITVKPDVSAIVQIGNFILLVILLNIVLYKPIRGILAARKEKVEGLKSSIQSSDSQVSEKEEEFNVGIREARAKGVAVKDALIDEASQEEKKILGEISEKTQADLAEIREKISKDVESVRVKLQGEIDGFASAIFEKILGRAS